MYLKLTYQPLAIPYTAELRLEERKLAAQGVSQLCSCASMAHNDKEIHRVTARRAHQPVASSSLQNYRLGEGQDL